MRQLAVISGKGGTGKTTISAALAYHARPAVLADCDVDAADLHLVLQPQLESQEPFHGPQLARIDRDRCDECGLCIEHCRFAAITDDLQVLRDRCEGCGVCELVCPLGAVTMTQRVSGVVRRSTTRLGPLVDAELGIGEEASGLLTTLVRRRASEVAEAEALERIIIDGPPGIGCPAIAATRGTDMVLVVTEPTPSGIHDLQRALAMVRHFAVPVAVAVNKADINPTNTHRILQLCQSASVPVVGVLPYDEAATAAMIAGRTVPEYRADRLAHQIREMWSQLIQIL